MIAEIVFAAGCFWGVEKHFESLPGVVDVKSGYVGGNFDKPTYQKVLAVRKYKSEDIDGIINHTEGVLVKFDTTKTNAGTLIKSFWEIHDPTQLNRQGNDIGNNYRSALFYTNDNQRKIAYETKATYQTLLSKEGYGKIVTEIRPLDKFYDAEGYHQDYLKKNPNGYCPVHATGVKFDKDKQTDVKKATDKVIPLGGKEILVIEAEGFCPYCEKLEKDVLSKYNGTIPVRKAYKKDLRGFDIMSRINASPTIMLIEDGVELYAHKGYLHPKDFYRLVGAFKLGHKSEAFKVAFNKGTDARFCKEYDLFKNTPDGVFVDKVSGDILFDTKDRFNSGTGWLSFYKAVDGATIEKPDNSYGMKRVEVLASKSGIHLGHVFEEFGKRRFCINATVLEFVARKDIKK